MLVKVVELGIVKEGKDILYARVILKPNNEIEVIGLILGGRKILLKEINAGIPNYLARGKVFVEDGGMDFLKSLHYSKVRASREYATEVTEITYEKALEDKVE